MQQLSSIENPRVIFLGVGELGAACLRGLIASRFRPLLVLTTPVDRLAAPVELVCRQAEIACLRPHSINSAEVKEHISLRNPDLGILGGFGEILRPRIFSIPRFGFINLHLSLLPHYRGPRPWKWAIARGETVTGVTVHRVAKQIDRGAIIAQESVSISRTDDADSLFKKLVAVAPAHLLQSAEGMLSGRLVAIEQDPNAGSYFTGPLPEDACIAWHWPARRICNLIRGFAPWPGGRCRLDGHVVRLACASLEETASTAEPGTVLSISNQGTARVSAVDGVLHFPNVIDERGNDRLNLCVGQRFSDLNALGE